MTAPTSPARAKVLGVVGLGSMGFGAALTALRRTLKAIDVAAAAGHDGVAEDLAFHRVIGEATGNPQFTLLLGFLEQYLREGMRITRGNEARRRDFMAAAEMLTLL